MKLKDNDTLTAAFKAKIDVLIFSKNGYVVRFNKTEVPLTGVKSSGVKGINLKDDEVVSAMSIEKEEYIDLFTTNKTAKRLKTSEILATGRAKKGTSVIKKVKSVIYHVFEVLATDSRDIILLKSDSEIKEVKNSDINIMDLASTGSAITKNKLDAVSKKVYLESYLKKEEKKEDVTKVKELTIDDFLDDFKI
jgi:topoisomerase-4 subunit A